MKLTEIKAAKTHGVYADVYGNWEDFPGTFVVPGGWTLTLSTLQSGNLTYDIGRIMGDDNIGRFYVFYGPTSRRWVITNYSATNSNQVVASKEMSSDTTIRPDDFKEAKKWVTDQLNHVKVLGESTKMPETKKSFIKLINHLPKEMYIGKGVTAELDEAKPNKVIYLLKQLMIDEPIGELYLFRRGSELWIATHHMDQRMIGVDKVTEYNLDNIRSFVLDNLPPLTESVRSDELESKGWEEFTVEPISGRWPVSRMHLWDALDAAFGNRNWNFKDANDVHRQKWAYNRPITYIHSPDAKLDYKKLKDAGFQITFLPD